MTQQCCIDLVITEAQALNAKYTLLKTTYNTPLPIPLPGQFVEVRIDNTPQVMLRRPISINFFDVSNNELWLLVAAIGPGTQWLASRQKGDTINCMLPLGNTFTPPVSNQERCLLVGGGVGVAPMLMMGKAIYDLGGKPVFLLGARTANDLLELEMFRKYGEVFLTTEDGSAGEKGYVTQHSVLRQENFDRIYTCGPKPMMVAVAQYAQKASTPCEASLENLMACGIGACLCCVEKTTRGNICVCKEGPVMNTQELLWLKSM